MDACLLFFFAAKNDEHNKSIKIIKGKKRLDKFCPPSAVNVSKNNNKKEEASASLDAQVQHWRKKKDQRESSSWKKETHNHKKKKKKKKMAGPSMKKQKIEYFF